MKPRQVAAVSGLAALAVAVGWVLFVALPRWYAAGSLETVGPSTPDHPAERRIQARLFYVAEDGLRLASIEREIPYADTLVAQARRIVEAQLEPPPPPLASALPSGTRLRDLFVDESGIVYVNLSGEVTSQHTGGSLDEILAVYALVNAVTVNLPAARAVQLLVDGREVDTLAGHVDLRHPLRKNLKWAGPTGEESPSATVGMPGG